MPFNKGLLVYRGAYCYTGQPKKGGIKTEDPVDRLNKSL